ncbi:ferredoxin [Nocardia sp. NPDC019395]|uniref:ferredoxin n=1 Tax=Nocardia sp. NPDC019395 TaxID=3154686 RepID=UPI0033F16D51
MAGWTVEVDRTACLGCGVCVSYAPKSFEQDDEGQAVFLDPPADPEPDIRMAVDGCPTGALRLSADDRDRADYEKKA